MEELRSTEILDKEILEDARKRAERILAASKTDVDSILAEVSVRTKKMCEEKTALYNEKIAAHKRDIAASLPLEKQRYLVSFVMQAVNKLIEEYLASLPASKKITLLKKLLIRYSKVLKGQKIKIQAAGFDLQAIQKLVGAELGMDSIIECRKMDTSLLSELTGEYGLIEGMIIETEDKKKSCRVTINELIAEMTDTYSFELASTLFGGRVPE